MSEQNPAQIEASNSLKKKKVSDKLISLRNIPTIALPIVRRLFNNVVKDHPQKDLYDLN